MASETTRRLIINADDFGASTSINQAVLRAHQEGILTTASLMVNGDAFEEAVAIAQSKTSMGVGLHLTLVCGRATLPPGQIPCLVNAQGKFSDNPVTAGMRYFFVPSAKAQLREEIHAQFRKFHRTGLLLDHVNGHLNMHLHPTVFRILMEDAEELGIHRLRCTYDPFWLDVRMRFGSSAYRLSHALIYWILSTRARGELRKKAIGHTRHVFGLLQNGRVDSSYLEALLARLPEGDSEVYSHPSLDAFRHEFEALINPRFRSLIDDLNIQRIRYHDL